MHRVDVFEEGVVINGIKSAAKKNHTFRRRHKVNNVRVVRANHSDIRVRNVGGDELSEAYAKWLMKQKSITIENIESLELSFGDSVVLKNGVLKYKSCPRQVHKHFQAFKSKMPCYLIGCIVNGRVSGIFVSDGSATPIGCSRVFIFGGIKLGIF